MSWRRLCERVGVARAHASERANVSRRRLGRDGSVVDALARQMQSGMRRGVPPQLHQAAVAEAQLRSQHSASAVGETHS